MRGAFLGFFVDMFDIYLPIVALAPAIGYFVAGSLSSADRSLVTSLIFVATLVGRPIGAFVFGYYADRIGRKRATITALSGCGVLTIIIAVLPGYQQWGSLSLVLFIALRFVVGIFVGGEYTAASPLAMEYSPKQQRGRNGGLIMSGFPLAFVAISILTLAMLHLAPAGALDSPYVQWGWRIPFLFGGLLALSFAWYFARHVEESDLFTQAGGTSAPIKQLFRGQNLRNFGQVFVLMTGFWLMLNTVTAILPATLKSHRFGLTPTQTSVVLIVAFLAAAAGYIISGIVSQRVGRRRFLIGWGLMAATAGSGVYYALLSIAPSNLAAVIVLTTVTVVLVTSHWGLATVYINERFHTGVRASGFGLGYSLAVVGPAFYAFYQAQLAHVMTSTYTVLPLLVIGALLVTVGAAMGPETKDVDFADPEPGNRPTRSEHTLDSVPTMALPVAPASARG